MSTRYRGGALRIDTLSVNLAGQGILHDASLEVAAGTTTVVVGPSGSGKTTLLRTIAGFVSPHAGEIRLDGSPISKLPVHRRSIGLVAQDGALFPHLSVAGNISFGLDSSTMSRRQVRHRVAELLELVSLPTDYGARRPHQLSGGQRQRVALARALASVPQVILLDEPFSALDAGLREKTRKAVQKVLHSTGTTALLVTHDQDEALSFADQVAVLTEGRLRQVGDPQEVYSRPADLETAQFLGEAVVLTASVTGGVAKCALGEIPLRNSVHDGEAHVILRPEQIAPAPTGEGALGVVLDSDYFGHDTTATVRIHGEDQLIRIRQLNTEPAAMGATIELSVHGRGTAYPRRARQDRTDLRN